MVFCKDCVEIFRTAFGKKSVFWGKIRQKSINTKKECFDIIKTEKLNRVNENNYLIFGRDYYEQLYDNRS